MMSSIITILLMSVVGIWMMAHGCLRSTRRMALVPLAVCGVEMLVFGLLHASLFPVLTAILWVMRLLILACCGCKIRQDRMVARRRARREQLAAVAVPKGTPSVSLPYCA